MLESRLIHGIGVILLIGVVLFLMVKAYQEMLKDK